jgi:hypothetical protein
MSESLEGDIASMRKRVDVLAAKRTEAKATFDSAVSERQAFLLQGDLADEKVADRLQKAVDTAASRVSGFDSALLVLQTQLDDAEAKLRAEQEQAERDRVANEMIAAVTKAESMVQPWLVTTREFIATLGALAPVSFELGQASEFVAKLAGEIEIALAIALPDLHRHAESVRLGGMPTPKFPRPEPEIIEVQAISTPTSPGEDVQIVFTLKPVKWRARDGQVQTVQRWEDCSMPTRLLARATRHGAITLDMTDKRRKENRGMLGGFSAPPHAYIDLDAELLPPPDLNVLPEGFEKLDRGPARLITHMEPRR